MDSAHARQFIDTDTPTVDRQAPTDQWAPASARLSLPSLPPHRRSGLYLRRHLHGAGRTFILARLLLLNIRYEDGLFFATHPDFDLDGYGPSEEKAVHAFEEMFDYAWSALVDNREASLTPHAQEVRDRLRAMVARIDG